MKDVNPCNLIRPKLALFQFADWLKALDMKRFLLRYQTVEFVARRNADLPPDGGTGRLRFAPILPRGRIARVLFCIYEGRMVLLHGFIKKLI